MLAWSTETKKRADDAAAAKKKAKDAEQARLLALEQQGQHNEAAAKAADEERIQRREKIFSGEQTLLKMAAEWRTEAENGKLEDSENKIALLLSHLTTCITQQEDIHSLDDSLAHIQGHLRQLEQRPVAAPDASSSNTFDRLEALEMGVGSLKVDVKLQQTATQQLEQRICTAANPSSSEPRETAPKFYGQEIFCDSMKINPIPWFRKFELTLQLHNIKEHKHHTYLYSRSGGACQAWRDNLLSKYGVVAADLHTKISWDDLKAAQGQTGKLSTAESDSTTLSTPPEPVSSRVTGLHSEAQAEVDSPPLLFSFEDYAARLVPTLGTQAQGQDVCATSSPSDSGDLSSSSGSSRDSAREFNIEVLDPLTSEDFAWLPLPTTGRLPGPQCAALCAHLHTYLSFYAPPTPPTDDEVAVGNILAYVTKVARKFCMQRYDDNNAPLMYVRIQVGQASCSALLDSGASRNFMSQAFMQRVGLGAQVQRKANPTAIKLADGNTQQLLDRYIEDVPVYFTPHARKPVTFDILDTDFDIILGMPWLASADHTVNFHRRTLSVRDAFCAEVACTIPLPHPSIRCQVVTAKSFRTTCAYEQPAEISLCFMRIVAAADSSLTDLSLDPRVVRLLDESADIFESPTGVVPDRPISHEIILEAGAVSPKGCIYRMSEEELKTIFVYSRSLEDHLEHLRRVLETLRRAKYKANRDKCEFVRQELEYLGHFITPEDISPLSDKIQAIQEWPEPRNVTDVRSFLGLAGYYQRFIKGYSKIAAHLTKLQCEDRPFDFGEEARKSFLTLKAALLSAKVLRIYDPLLPTPVTTDASSYGIGAVLEQHDGVGWHPVEYFSKKVLVKHSIDDAHKKELLAFVHALKRWRHFLLGRSQFRWVTDNNPLVFYKTQDTVNSTIARWMAFIDQFDFFPDHIPGKSNHFADALSRRPDHCTAVYSTFEIDDNLRNSFIRGYQADPEFRDKYANCSSPNPAPSHYRIQEGYLLVHTRGKDLLCVPSDPHLRTRLLGEFHDTPATGHFGVNRTIGQLRKRFWWPDLLGDGTRYCKSCEVCRRCKSRNHCPNGELRPLPVPLRRREAIAMDITGPFPKHKTGVDGILTVVDRLTKFAMFLPCRYHAKAPELVEVLYAGWIRTKGYPKEIVCDRDTRFMSDFWLVLIKRWGSSIKPSSARHPQTDGQTERAHQSAQVLLRTLIRPDQKDWVERLPDVELAYNSSIHPAIRMSPFEFEHGSSVTSLLDTITPQTAESDDHLLFLCRMQELLVKSCDQMAKTQQRMSQQANR
ncbi:hypothetical protein CBR_g30346 [Chara braunii]|uniref:Integrase catalytic domain-containing protein n=1 Tax=Chara braunii TaxID=69332 RepID=A0A388JXF0_CHABU|nr:hypothetical protein CBR_g30346 [Chara braunii]|eukprot:GBG62393.1 hypothetical protein CBR_g30346 [Chara braunii]